MATALIYMNNLETIAVSAVDDAIAGAIHITMICLAEQLNVKHINLTHSPFNSQHSKRRNQIIPEHGQNGKSKKYFACINCLYSLVYGLSVFLSYRLSFMRTKTFRDVPLSAAWTAQSCRPTSAVVTPSKSRVGPGFCMSVQTSWAASTS